MGFDILLIIAGIILLLVAFAGCFLPVLPGPPLAFGALILLHFTTVTDVPSEVLWSMAGLALIVTILDYVVPVWGTRKFGGSKAGERGAIAGVIVGLFLGPLGIILAPFFGALAGELLSGTPGDKAFRSAIGSFIGFLLGVGLKLMVTLVIAFYFFKIWLF
ncbi:DUF456 domain-containing protein [Bacteroidales bacterium MB20-C3-3]|nr:DUF456 domain-containing protein [Bacteroidales bacterium MB20-C3-3]